MMATNKTPTYRPPPLEREYGRILYLLRYNGRGKIKTLVRKALTNFLLNELDVVMNEQHNGDNSDTFNKREAELLAQWLKEKSNELFKKTKKGA